MRDHRKLLPVFLVLILLGLVLSACKGGANGGQPIFGPEPTVPLQDSNPVFLATPKPGESIPTPTRTEPGSQTEAAIIPQEHELYFVVNDFASGRLSLVNLPFNCILQTSHCQGSVVPSYPNVNETIRPLMWSPRGDYALLPFLEELHRYDPVADAWQVIAHIPVSELPEWSPNGEWIAFISMNIDRKSIHILRPDGTEPQNLTANRFNSPDDHLASLFWLDNENIAFWYLAPGKDKGLFQVNIRTGEMNPLIQLSGMTKEILAYSPDRQKVAMETFQNGESWFALSNPDGSNFTPLRSFGPSAIWPMVWSPDSQWVAFSVYRMINERQESVVYLANRDGQAEVKELFASDYVPALVWAPDSQHLIVQAEKDSPSRLYVVDVLSGEAWPLKVESLGEGASISGVSWR